MPDAFQRAMVRVFQHEGGYVDHPRDPGGATNMGITRRTLAQWRGVPIRDLPKSEVRDMTKEEAVEIYRARYWDSVRGDELPPGVAFALFDFAVNSGPVRAVKHLQKVVGVPTDGIIGGMTIRAARRMEVADLVNQLQDSRLRFMQGLSIWPTFARGWAKRVESVRREAIAFTGGGGGW